MDGLVIELLNMIDDFELGNGKYIFQDVLDFLGKNCFFFMIILKKFGGFEFSLYVNFIIVVIIVVRSGVIVVIVMVFNLLGLGEFFMYYGMIEQ